MHGRALALALVLAAALAPAARARPIGGHCTTYNYYFDVTGIQLDETITAHWAFDSDQTPSQDRATATLDTTQAMHVDFHRAHGTKAERRKYRQMALFEELVGGCRVPNFRQGFIHVKAPVARYTMQGGWQAGGQSGTCADERTTTRAMTGQLVRLTTKTDPPSKTIGQKWIPGAPADLDCPFSAFSQDKNALVDAHLGPYQFSYIPVQATIPKAKVFKHKLVTLPLTLTGDGLRRGETAGDLWNRGTVTPHLSLHGSVTLKRYKICVVTPKTDLSKRTCLLP
jgi:hypothetical protein